MFALADDQAFDQADRPKQDAFDGQVDCLRTAGSQDQILVAAAKCRGDNPAISLQAAESLAAAACTEAGLAYRLVSKSQIHATTGSEGFVVAVWSRYMVKGSTPSAVQAQGNQVGAEHSCADLANIAAACGQSAA